MPAESGQDMACYVYGIAPADIEFTAEVDGVGDPPAPVRMIRHGDISALVSDIDTSGPLGRPEDLMAHEELLDRTAAEAPVLPLRFGAAVTSEEAVTEELLSPHHDEFAAALRELEGKAQYVVKGRYVEDAVLSEVLSENPQADELRQQIKAAGDEDATRDLRIRLGELVNQAVAAKREQDTRRVGDVLEPYCVASNVREPTHEEDAVHVAVLVETARQDDLEQALSELAREWEGRISLQLLGPMAAYDFVATLAPAG
ncbi:MAG: GvpL/GvpF family gas vesicle protein [Gemmatimonadota bacterium]